jgi:hypothetical protein
MSGVFWYHSYIQFLVYLGWHKGVIVGSDNQIHQSLGYHSDVCNAPQNSLQVFLFSFWLIVAIYRLIIVSF